jgi:very-short-patch-repair endonuclease
MIGIKLQMARYHYKNYRGITILARDLRNNQTLAEKLLWNSLRRKKVFGYKFLRQYPVFYRISKGRVEFFIADFYCSRLKLIIEVDGPIHFYQKESDSERDAKLLNKGIKVLRIENDEVMDIKSVLKRIEDSITERLLELSDNK